MLLAATVVAAPGPALGIALGPALLNAAFAAAPDTLA